ncbi:hypothetical protein TIFTF001_004451 [Ficus carica]|uniref:Uncharacterized protein n=1 Tax=Ficus carica TaxID=3494 RepID=A0AA88CT69_FICCA|nr:hypothetical protein TIFTF001_004451 [Ficus carica]
MDGLENDYTRAPSSRNISSNDNAIGSFISVATSSDRDLHSVVPVIDSSSSLVTSVPSQAAAWATVVMAAKAIWD